MNKIIHVNINDDVSLEHKVGVSIYEYYRRIIVPRNEKHNCVVAIYEIPPKKSAFPYHYHLKNEETFYIISGEGILKTIEGERNVRAGDIIYFPNDPNGAHKLTNTSDTANLVYIDFDTSNDLEVAIYPDSKKIGIYASNIAKIYKIDQNVDYYEDE